MKNDLTSLEDMDSETLGKLVATAEKIKANKEEFAQKLEGKTLLSIFEKPSLRTRISFEVAMQQLGGKAITIDTQTTTIGKKESIEDTAKVVSRYVDIIMARMYSQQDVEKLAKNASVPVINGLTDKYHPCQILSDLLTIKEHKGKLKDLKLAFVGDGNNNVTHCLLIGCALAGIDISIACPKKHSPQEDVLEKAMKKASGTKIEITENPKKAVHQADVVYTDTWMSYQVKDAEKEQRIMDFGAFQVTEELMQNAKKSAVFMHCLPAQRGYEQTAEVIDGKQSIVFDQAENRMHMQKAILLYSKGLL